jgi:hypothetical protein
VTQWLSHNSPSRTHVQCERDDLRRVQGRATAEDVEARLVKLLQLGIVPRGLAAKVRREAPPVSYFMILMTGTEAVAEFPRRFCVFRDHGDGAAVQVPQTRNEMQKNPTHQPHLQLVLGGSDGQPTVAL